MQNSIEKDYPKLVAALERFDKEMSNREENIKWLTGMTNWDLFELQRMGYDELKRLRIDYFSGARKAPQCYKRN